MRALILEELAAHAVVGRVGVSERGAPVAPTDDLVSIAYQDRRFMTALDRTRDRMRKQLAVPALLSTAFGRQPSRDEGVHDVLVRAGTDFDPVGARLPPDLGPPGVDVLDIRCATDDISTSEQPAVVVAAVDTTAEPIDTAADFNWIVHRPSSAYRGTVLNPRDLSRA